jgi:septation ring formation regulator
LTDRGVVFAEGVVEEALNEVDDLRLQGLKAIAGLKVKEANTISTTLNQKIQELYDLLEEEYQAYHRYFKQQERVNTEFDRVKEQNHSLLLELTYLKGRFILGHEEEDRQASYHHDIEGLVLSQQEVQRALKEGSQTYSWAVTR